jgi:hypothetical protein
MEVESQIRVLNLPLFIPNEGYSGGMAYYATPGIKERCSGYFGESKWVSFSPEIRKHAAATVA